MTNRLKLSHNFTLIFLYLCFSTAQVHAQQRFPTPKDAVLALARAADSEDPASFTPILGAHFTREVSSGDPQADRIGVQRLGTLMRQGYTLTVENPVTIIIKVGADGWPFPIPIAMTKAKDWVFNVEAGKETLLKRRIEKNEERAIKIADAYATAQKKYRSMSGNTTYASRLLSTTGRKDGLYWETGPDGIVSPLEALVDRVQNLGYRKQGSETPVLAGYHFRVLTAQGEYAPGKSRSYLDSQGNMTKGFGLFAYPTRYGVSGIMSFIVGTDGAVYQRDLGEGTDEIAAKVTQYDPDPSWNLIGGKIPVTAKKVRYIETGDGAYPFYSDYRP